MHDEYLSPAEVCQLLPEMTPRRLKELRYRGGGPPFVRLTYKTVVYPAVPLNTWIRSNLFTRNDQPVSAN